jgi:hypothetical protein
MLQNAGNQCLKVRFLVFFPMEPSKQSRGRKDLFRERLDAIIDLKHPLVRLAGRVPWSDFDEAFGRFYKPLGRRAKAIRPSAPTATRSTRAAIARARPGLSFPGEDGISSPK